MYGQRDYNVADYVRTCSGSMHTGCGTSDYVEVMQSHKPVHMQEKEEGESSIVYTGKMVTQLLYTANVSDYYEQRHKLFQRLSTCTEMYVHVQAHHN